MATGGKGPRPGGRPGGKGLTVNLDKAKDSKKTLKRLFKYLNKFKCLLGIVAIFVILSVILDLASSVILQPIIDDYIIPLVQNPTSQELKTGCIRMIMILVGISVGAAFTTFVYNKIMIKVSQLTVKAIRKDVFAKVQKLPIKYFDTNSYGDLMSRIVNDIDNIMIALNTSVTQIISGVLMLVGTLVTMFVISPLLAMISIVALPFLGM